MGHLGKKKNRSHSPNMEKPCEHSRCYCFGPNILEIGQKGYLDVF
jgi:hypothetical protein